MNFYKSRTFRLTLLFLILIEIFSYLGSLYPLFNTIAFFIILLMVLILTLEKLEYGLYIVFAELFIGSKGYLFYFDTGSSFISLRVGLFLIVMAVWLKEIMVGNRNYKKLMKRFIGQIAQLGQFNAIVSSWPKPFFRFFRLDHLWRKITIYNWYFLVLAVIAWGIISGFLHHNNFSNIFLDVNAYLFFLLIFPTLRVLKNKEIFSNIFQIFLAALIVLTLKTLFLLFVFSHQILVMMPSLYYWIRLMGLGEITQISAGFYRIFLQSHIFNLIGFFVFLVYFWRNQVQDSILSIQHSAFNIPFLSFILASIIISFSRSFWAGGMAGLVLFYGFIMMILKVSLKRIFEFSLWLGLIILIGMGIVWSTVHFPYPRPQIGVSLGSLIEERGIDLAKEAAARSRWNLLPELKKEISKAPLLGKGFGSIVTYQSTDPRQVSTTAGGSGIYTTYAFEWGYLDLWLKIGLVGLLIYLGLLIKIIGQGGRMIMQNAKCKMQNEVRKAILDINGQWLMVNVHLVGLLLGLVVLAVVNIFTPYLNHPLGIGYIILVSAIFRNSDFLRISRERIV